MDLAEFNKTVKRLEEQSAFGGYDKVVVSNYTPVRLLEFASNFEHFIPVVDPEKPNAARPFYCGGPKTSCKLCKVSTTFMASNDARLKEYGERIRAKECFYFECLDRTPEGSKSHAETKHTKLLAQSKNRNGVGPMILKGLGEVVEMCQKQNAEPAWSNLANFDVIICKSGKGFETKYSVQFSGIRTPLNPEELAYGRYDLKEIAKLTDPAIIDKVAVVAEQCRAMQLSEIPGNTKGGDTSFNPAVLQGQQSQQLGQGNISQLYPNQGQVTPPVQQAPSQPAASPVQPQQFQDNNLQDTKVVEPFDTAKQLRVPCVDCKSLMQITVGDPRMPKCWHCGKVFQAIQAR